MSNSLSRAETILSKLVRFKSVSDNTDASSALLDYVESELQETPLTIMRYVSDGFPSLVATSKGANPRLWLVCHIDVVDASDDMFTMQATDDRLIGRGTIDNKFAAAAFIDACLELGDEVRECDFGIIMVSDEEIGSQNGMSFLMEELNLQTCDVAFVPDSGTGWTIETNAKGVLHYKFKATGKAAHGSMPWLGENAIDTLYRFIETLREELKIPSPTDAESGFLRTLNIGRIGGGKAANQVPVEAEAIIDLRFPKASDMAEIRRTIKRLTRTHSNVRSEELMSAYPVDVSSDNPWLKKYISFLNLRGIKPEFSKSNGATDARFFAQVGVPTIVSQPDGGNLHADGEWLDRRSFGVMSGIVQELIKETM